MSLPSLTKTLIDFDNFSLLPLDFSKLTLSRDDKTKPTYKKDPLHRFIRSKRRRWRTKLGSGRSRFMIRKRSGSVGNICSISGFDSEGSDWVIEVNPDTVPILNSRMTTATKTRRLCPFGATILSAARNIERTMLMLLESWNSKKMLNCGYQCLRWELVLGNCPTDTNTLRRMHSWSERS
ncbi:hypothetical protein RJ641_021085 [Dillenia turbinata]|uniref:Uncharacterized protein n=1 Tax=Dillenia turbinata TaxID=194707 RepID=A0AAN8UGU1_9MAGN